MAATFTPAILPEKSSAGGHRIPELDGIRGLAVVLVLIYHYAVIQVPESRLLYYLSLPPHLMWSGVDLFFVLSGFLIGGILLDHRESRSYYRTFYARRIHRIFPLYYLMIAVLFAGVWMFPVFAIIGGENAALGVSAVRSELDGGLHSRSSLDCRHMVSCGRRAVLSHISIHRAIALKKSPARADGLLRCGGSSIANFARHRGLALQTIYPLLPCRADALALGVIAAIIVRTAAAKAWISGRRKILFLCLLALIASLPTMLKWTSYRYVGTVGYSMLALMYFLLIVLVLIAPTRLMTQTFSAGWLRRLGVISYCAYLIHEPVRRSLFLLLRLGKNPVITDLKTLMVTAAALFVTLAVAQVSWVVLEKPLIRRARLRHQYTSSGSWFRLQPGLQVREQRCSSLARVQSGKLMAQFNHHHALARSLKRLPSCARALEIGTADQDRRPHRAQQDHRVGQTATGLYS